MSALRLVIMPVPSGKTTRQLLSVPRAVTLQR
jgi:hypothetical protein